MPANVASTSACAVANAASQSTPAATAVRPEPPRALHRRRQDAVLGLRQRRVRVLRVPPELRRGRVQHDQVVDPGHDRGPGAASTCTTVVRTRSPARAKEYPVAPIGVQPYSSTEIRARVIGSCEETKNDASSRPNASGSTPRPAPWPARTPCSSASRSAARWSCRRSGARREVAGQRRGHVPVPDHVPAAGLRRPRATRTTRTSALPYRLAPSWTTGTSSSCAMPRAVLEQCVVQRVAPQRQRRKPHPGGVPDGVGQRRGDRVERRLAHRLGAQRAERVAAAARTAPRSAAGRPAPARGTRAAPASSPARRRRGGPPRTAPRRAPARPRPRPGRAAAPG